MRERDDGGPVVTRHGPEEKKGKIKVVTTEGRKERSGIAPA